MIVAGHLTYPFICGSYTAPALSVPAQCRIDIQPAKGGMVRYMHGTSSIFSNINIYLLHPAYLVQLNHLTRSVPKSATQDH